MIETAALVVALALASGQPLPPPPSPAPAAPRPAPARPGRLAVADFVTSGGANPALGRALAELAAAEAGRVGGSTVITQGEIANMLGLERTKQLLSCSDQAACLVEIAGALDVDRLLAGELTLVDRTALLVVRLIDVRRAKTLARGTQSLREATEPELFDAARRLTHEVLTGQRLETAGFLVVKLDEPGAQVSVDGRVVGTTPGLGPVRVPEGKHDVTAQKPGFITWKSTVAVASGEHTAVEIRLVALPREGPSSGKIMGWTSVGAGAAALVLGGVALVRERDAGKHYDTARKLTGPGGDLVVGATPAQFRSEVDAGNSSHRGAIGFGVGAGVAVAGSVVFGILAYRQTGEIGPFRF
jgi:hypothetical protein